MPTYETPQFMPSYQAGRQNALATTQVAQNAEELNLRRLQILQGLAGVRGLSPDLVEGVLNRDPVAISKVAALPNGLSAIARLMPDVQKSPMVGTQAGLALAQGVLGVPLPSAETMFPPQEVPLPEGQQGPPEMRSTMPTEIPATTLNSLIAGRAGMENALRRQETGDLMSQRTGDIGYLRYLVSQAGNQLDADKEFQDAQAEFNRQAGVIAEGVGKTVLAQLGDLNYPSPKAQAIAAKLQEFALAEMAYHDQLGQGRILGAKYTNSYKLGPKMSGKQQQEALDAINADLEELLRVLPPDRVPPQLRVEPRPGSLGGPGGGGGGETGGGAGGGGNEVYVPPGVVQPGQSLFNQPITPPTQPVTGGQEGTKTDTTNASARRQARQRIIDGIVGTSVKAKRQFTTNQILSAIGTAEGGGKQVTFSDKDIAEIKDMIRQAYEAAKARGAASGR